MCGNFFKPSSSSFLGGPIGRTVLSAAAIPVLGPEVGALTGLGSEAAGALTGAGVGGLLGASGGGGLKGGLIGGGLGGLGGYLSGGGLSDFLDSTGLGNAFGSPAVTPSAPGSVLDPTQSIAPTATSAAPASTTMQAYIPSSGIPSAGGGTPGGFFSYDVNGAPASTASGIASGVGGTASQPGFLSSIFSPTNNTGSFNYDISGAPAAASSYSIPDQFANAASTGGTSSMNLSSLLPTYGNMANGTLKAGLGYFLNQNPSTKGLQAAYNQSAANYQPYLQTGQAANTTLANLYGLNGTAAQNAATQNWQNTPGYQFNLNQAIQAINANDAARGLSLSGNNQKAVADYASGLANQYYNNYLNNLQQQAGQGLAGAQGVGSGLSNSAGAGYQSQVNQTNNQNQALGGLLNSFFPTAGSPYGLSYLTPQQTQQQQNGLLAALGQVL